MCHPASVRSAGGGKCQIVRRDAGSWLPDEEFQHLASRAAALAAPVPTAPSTEAETEGCLIVDPAGDVLAPAGASYVRRGNCLEEPLDDIWAESPARSAVISNKRWPSVLS